MDIEIEAEEDLYEHDETVWEMMERTRREDEERDRKAGCAACRRRRCCLPASPVYKPVQSKHGHVQADHLSLIALLPV